MSQFRVDGQGAVVTGGGSGIGLAISRALAAAGARVVVVGRRESLLQEAADQIHGHAIVGDVTDLVSLPEIVKRAEDLVGPLRILVNNAGSHLKKPALETEDSAFARILDTHVRGPFALAREASRGMLAAGGGSIVFIGSMATVMGIPQVCAYSAAKGAVSALARSLAAEWSPRGIRVNVILPGWIETEMSRRAFEGDPERKAKVLGRTPAGRLGRDEDVAQAVVYLCSPAASFLTGSEVTVDGGASIGF